MIEYLYNAIRISGDYDETITAIITDEKDEVVREAQLIIYDEDAKSIISYSEGTVNERGIYEFVIPGEITSSGRYWYEITNGNNSLCFKQPLYII